MITRGCRERQECLFIYRHVTNRIDTGATLTSATVTVIVWKSVRTPSETTTSKVYGRVPGSVGVQVKAPAGVMLAPTGAPLKEKVSVWTGTS